MHPSEPLAYLPKPAAQYLGIGLTSLYAEIKAGRITARKYGRRTLIPAEDLKAWLAALPEMKGAA
jgi:excisionase family DNA binding protein